jgi:hypothetical protein
MRTVASRSLTGPARTRRRWLAALASAAVLAASAVSAQPPPSAPPESAPLTAMKLRPATAPDGAFAIGLPEGWRLLPARRGDDEVQATAPDGRVRAYLFPLISLTDLYVRTSGLVPQYRRCIAVRGVVACADALAQVLAGFVARPHGPRDALALLTAVLRRRGMAPEGLRIARETPVSAEGTATIAAGGSTTAEWFLLQSRTVPNPLFPQPGSVESFAFLRGCEGPGDGLAAGDLRSCAAVLASFRPAPAWINRPVQAVLGFYVQMQRELQNSMTATEIYRFGEQSIAQYRQTQGVIANWGDRVRAMQMQQSAQTMATTMQTAGDWMNALTGARVVTDPQTGTSYLAETHFQTFRHYCLSAGQLYGLNGTGGCGVNATTLNAGPPD